MQVCGRASDVWICLICGHLGCGRYHAKHAVDHWKETNHCYALEIQTQRVSKSVTYARPYPQSSQRDERARHAHDHSIM